ncbi:MAG: hypothetical protein E7228_04995 [Clostridiales bacterium]|nr:hypothetical protein [Clostridiales bacterium]
MTDYEIYVFILCFIVFSVLTLLFSYMIVTLTKMRLKMIRHGLEDEEIKIEQQKKAKKSRIGTFFVNAVGLIICLALLTAFVFSIYMNVTEEKLPNGIPSLKVVQSASMATKDEANTYLYENDLNDQIQVFDVIITRHLPEEEDLQLYDIVTYKQDDMNIVHRIVGIEEPNAKHPHCRHFLLQGDAVKNPDQFPVLYSQMQGIYKGERIPYIGSFIIFMQSPAGWLCILLVLFSMIFTPVLKKKLDKEIKIRQQIIDSVSTEDDDINSEKEKSLA